jgi:NAD(P)H-quinone oxidoreductase subunit K
MAKRSLGMVLILKYFICGNEVGNYMKSFINFAKSPLLDKKTPNSILKTTFNDFKNWASHYSLWPLLYGTSYCFIEFASLISSRIQL